MKLNPTAQLQTQMEFPPPMDFGNMEGLSLAFLLGNDKIASLVREYLGRIFAEYMITHRSGAHEAFLLSFLTSMLGSELSASTYRTVRLLDRENIGIPPIIGLKYPAFPVRDQLRTNLELQRGEIRELTDGVFIKKKEDDTLELYISQE